MPSTNARGWVETPWSDAGYGCSALVAKPDWQNDRACTTRSESDVAVVADPATGVAVYDTVPFHGRSGWQVFGGTSVGSPIVAAIYALAGNARTLPSAGRTLWAHAGTLNTVELPNGSSGYFGATGLGTPSGTSAF